MGSFSLPMSDCVNMKPHVKKIINGGNMQIEVTEINKISLNENELLFIKIPRIPRMSNSDKHVSTKVLKDNIPKDWRDRVFVIQGDIELTKVTKEK